MSQWVRWKIARIGVPPRPAAGDLDSLEKEDRE